MTHYYCFDLDDTLVATCDISEEAYRSVGVDVPPSARGLRWQEWLPDVVGPGRNPFDVHRAKVLAYDALLSATDITTRELPPAQVLRELVDVPDTHVFCATSSSLLTARRLVAALGIGVPVIANLTYAQRLDALLSPGELDGHDVTYVDDNLTTVVGLRRDAPAVDAVHYVNQSRDWLRARLQTSRETAGARRRHPGRR